SSVDLSGVTSGGITGAPHALPAAWNLFSGYLLGPSADLDGANLTGLDLTGADLTGVSGAAKYNSATILPAGFDPVAAGWTLVS
ncbi:MAG: pentapeptide repeat-containing protein, partial [Planctomycetota bacterium]|nr:pentapeptide repeat-containing protein [Planctomycetota bacterium]